MVIEKRFLILSRHACSLMKKENTRYFVSPFRISSRCPMKGKAITFEWLYESAEAKIRSLLDQINEITKVNKF